MMGDVMCRNITSRLTFFSVAFLFTLIFPTTQSVYAGAPRLGECIDKEQNRPVEILHQENLKTYADVIFRKSGGKTNYIIRINPTHYYLSRETQQWLFYRQCGRINQKQNSIKDAQARISLHEEREADCWAIDYMVNVEKLMTVRQIERINRDIEMLERNSERWRAIFGARRSRVSTSECLERKFDW